MKFPLLACALSAASLVSASPAPAAATTAPQCVGGTRNPGTGQCYYDALCGYTVVGSLLSSHKQKNYTDCLAACTAANEATAPTSAGYACQAVNYKLKGGVCNLLKNHTGTPAQTVGYDAATLDGCNS